MRGLIGGFTLLLYCLATKTRLPNKWREWGPLSSCGALAERNTGVPICAGGNPCIERYGWPLERHNPTNDGPGYNGGV